MIIDCHCHAGVGNGLTGPWDTRAPLDRYLRRAAAAGIGRSVVFPAFHSDYASANRELATIVARNPARLSAFAMVHCATDAGRLRAILEECVLGRGFAGIKVHRHDARITRELCELARRLRVPVLYDIVSEVSALDLLASEYPDVDFIIPHLGSFADDWRAQKSCIDRIVKYGNMFTDTSGVRYFDLLEEVVQRAGPHKVLFGSDGPWLHPAVELAKVQALELGEPARALVLGGNWLRLTSRRHRIIARSFPSPACRALAERRA